VHLQLHGPTADLRLIGGCGDGIAQAVDIHEGQPVAGGEETNGSRPVEPAC
jgi:hypothetical protein